MWTEFGKTHHAYTKTSIVTGFVKTLHVHTRIEIHFIAFYNSHTHALSRYNAAMDDWISFYK